MKFLKVPILIVSLIFLLFASVPSFAYSIYGSVTDSSADATDFDLISGFAGVTGGNLVLGVTFESGTFDWSKTLLQVALDTDQNSATGDPLFGWGADYFVRWGGSDKWDNSLYEWNESTSSWDNVTSSLTMTNSANSTTVTIPLNFDDGILDFYFSVQEVLDIYSATGAKDLMPDRYSAGGATAPVLCPQNLTCTGDFTIDGIDTTGDLDNLWGCSVIRGNLTVIHTGLTNLEELECIEEIGGDLWIAQNRSLVNLEGLENLTVISGRLRIIQASRLLETVDGLDNLESVGGDLEIIQNRSLYNVDGLQGLVSVGGDLRIRQNSNLPDIYGLDNLEYLYGDELFIVQNASLPTCQAEELRDRLNGWTGKETILQNNSWATCPALAQDFDGATYLALEFDGPSGIIRADPARVAAIDAELSLIREQYPLLSSIDVFPGFRPGSLIVSMTDEALSELEAGTFTGFDEIFEEYPVASIHIFTLLPAASIRFEEPLHSPNMLPLFLAVEGVTDAQADWSIGDGHDIILHDMGWYTFKYGWGDCPSGCMYEHYWEIQIQDGAAVVLQEWGDDMPVAAVE